MSRVQGSACTARTAALRAICMVALVAATGVVAACGSSSRQSAVRPAPLQPPATPPAAAARTSGAPIDRLTAIARRRYAEEVSGRAAHQELRRIARDAALRAALESGDQARLDAYVRSQYHNVWYHEHVSRLRIIRGSRIVIDLGVAFVVAPSQMTLHDARGRVTGTLQISMQDVIGFVRYMHRNYPVQVVARGNTPADVRSSLPTANPAALPDRGSTRIAGRRYDVRSWHALAFAHEPVTIWILAAIAGHDTHATSRARGLRDRAPPSRRVQAACALTSLWSCSWSMTSRRCATASSARSAATATA